MISFVGQLNIHFKSVPAAKFAFKQSCLRVEVFDLAVKLVKQTH